jgi:hypothetical protein
MLVRRRIGILLGGLALAGCATLAGTPAWVLKGTKIEGQEIYGVGAITGVANAPLAWEAADARARAAVGKFVETYVALLFRDFAASTGIGVRPIEEQNVERGQKTLVVATLHGVEPVDRYYEEKTGTYYVLVRLSSERLAHAVEAMGDLDERVREHVRRHADRLFDELAREEAARENRRREPAAP